MATEIHGSVFLEGDQKIELTSDGPEERATRPTTWPFTLWMGTLSVHLTDEQMDALNRAVAHRGRTDSSDAALYNLDPDEIERQRYGGDPQCPSVITLDGVKRRCVRFVGHDGSPHNGHDFPPAFLWLCGPGDGSGNGRLHRSFGDEITGRTLCGIANRTLVVRGDEYDGRPERHTYHGVCGVCVEAGI